MYSNKKNTLFFYFIERSIIQTQRKYWQDFNVRVSPSDNMIRNLIAWFERTGSVGDLSGRGPKRSVRTDTAVKVVRQSVLEGSSASTLRSSAQLGIVRTSLQKILKLNLNMFPYKIQIVQAFLLQDTQQCLQYAIRF